MQAKAQRLFLLGPLPGLALDVVELTVELVAHLGDRDRGAADPAVEGEVRAADMRHFVAAAAHRSMSPTPHKAKLTISMPKSTNEMM